MQIMLMNINDVTIKRKRGGLIRVKKSVLAFSWAPDLEENNMTPDIFWGTNMPLK